MATLDEAQAVRAAELRAQREPFVRATVVRAQRPTSAHAGDTALVLANGEIDGFLGGTCVEASVRQYSLAALTTAEPVLLRVVPGEPSRLQEEGAIEVTNPCLSGGAIEIFLEPQLPAPRVVVVGSTPVAQALASLGALMEFDVELVAGAVAAPRAVDAALIVASHGRDEEPALEAALLAGVPYIALVASEKRGSAVVESLEVAQELRSQVRTPAGLALGGQTPAEIALSIMAELVQLRSVARRVAEPEVAGPGVVGPGVAGPGVAGPGAPETAPLLATEHAAVPDPDTAIDPICQMSVAAVESSLHTDHKGERVYFCAPGCKRTFLKDPERYATVH